jgi:hypothetical protein
MPDHKSKTGSADRARVAGGQDYEVQYLTEHTGISRERALELIKAYGNDRSTLLKAAKGLASLKPQVRSSRL